MELTIHSKKEVVPLRIVIALCLGGSRLGTVKGYQLLVAWYSWWFRSPAIATWDGAKNLANHRRNYQPQLVSRISEPSTLVPEHDSGFVFASFSEINSISIPQIHSVGRCWPSLQEKLKCFLCFAFFTRRWIGRHAIKGGFYGPCAPEESDVFHGAGFFAVNWSI